MSARLFIGLARQALFWLKTEGIDVAVRAGVERLLAEVPEFPVRRTRRRFRETKFDAYFLLSLREDFFFAKIYL